MLTIDATGQTVLVTGGAKGIGRAISEKYLSLGADVVACGRNEPDQLPTVGGATASFIACDVRDAEQVDAMVTQLMTSHGRLDVVVNNAGGSPYRLAADASPGFHEKILALNLTAALHVSQRANTEMQQQADGGSIVNIASVSGIRPSPGTAAYGAAKAGLLSLTESLAVEWAPKVRVNAITCGMIETELAELHYGDADGIAAVAATVPMQRMGTPEDVANACALLSSPLTSYAAGSALLLHGGGERPAFLDAATTDH